MHHRIATCILSSASTSQRNHENFWCPCSNWDFHLLKVATVTCLLGIFELVMTEQLDSPCACFLLDILLSFCDTPHGINGWGSYLGCTHTWSMPTRTHDIMIHHSIEWPTITSGQKVEWVAISIFCLDFGQWLTLIIHTVCCLAGDLPDQGALLADNGTYWLSLWDSKLLPMLRRRCTCSQDLIMRKAYQHSCWIASCLLDHG